MNADEPYWRSNRAMTGALERWRTTVRGISRARMMKGKYIQLISRERSILERSRWREQTIFVKRDDGTNRWAWRLISSAIFTSTEMVQG